MHYPQLDKKLIKIKFQQPLEPLDIVQILNDGEWVVVTKNKLLNKFVNEIVFIDKFKHDQFLYKYSQWLWTGLK